jgi:hypothetical protein
MTKEVEILKIGTILPSTIENENTIMVVYNGGPIFEYYVSILRENCDEYKYLKTHQSIVGGPYSYRPGKNDNRLIGELDGDLVVGMSFTVGSWHSSIVQKIINKNVAITNNSVYAIHNVSEFRDKKLKDLGL